MFFTPKLSVVVLFAICQMVAAEARACVQRQSSNADDALASTSWLLTSFVSDGAETSVTKGISITLKFGPNNRVTGSGGCNSYSGEYRAREDVVSFSRLVSTKKACLQQDVNQQEQRYFAALESANKFKVAEDRLTIFYDSDRGSLNFVKDSPDSARSDCDDGPVLSLASFYDAINEQQFDRAYAYWESPPMKFNSFKNGYAQTVKVHLVVQPPVRISGAAGSLYAKVPSVIIASARDGSEKMFAGCYVMRKSNLRPPDTPEEPRWHIYRASVSAITGNERIQNLLANGCRN